MDRTEVNASPVQKALQGIKKYKYVLLTALLGVLLLLLPPVGSGIALSAAALGPRDLLSCASLAASSVSSSRRTRS